MTTPDDKLNAARPCITLILCGAALVLFEWILGERIIIAGVVRWSVVVARWLRMRGAWVMREER